ncbi:MAG TPA: hypothetical protein VF062_06720 [Candidatus Limnocylindrales bacterium]
MDGVLIGLSGVMVLDSVTVAFALSTLVTVRIPDLLFRKREVNLEGDRRRPAPPSPGAGGWWRWLALTPAMVLAYGDGGGLLSVVTMVGAVGCIADRLAMALWGGRLRAPRHRHGRTRRAHRDRHDSHWVPGKAVLPPRRLAAVMASIALADAVFEPAMAPGGWLATAAGGVLGTEVGTGVGTGPGRGMGLLLVLLGFATVGLAAIGLRWRTLHRMEDALPDAVPGAVVTWDRDRLQGEADRLID